MASIGWILLAAKVVAVYLLTRKDFAEAKVRAARRKAAHS